jgi:hypothetical protein
MISPNGQGRHNFIGVWENTEIEPDYTVGGGFWIHAMLDSDKLRWLPVPYSSIPHGDLVYRHEQARIRNFFSVSQVIELLGGICTIPPDERLDLNFQLQVLRHHRDSVDTAAYVIRIRNSLQTLKDLGGSLQITELDDRHGQYTYQPFNCASAAEVEEWFLSIAPKFFRVSLKGYPFDTEPGNPFHRGESRLMNRWKRIM